MPMFDNELNRIADEVVAEPLRLYLHVDPGPSNADPDGGRVTGNVGGMFTGIDLAPTDWTDATHGDVQTRNAINVGTATARVGTLKHWSLVRDPDGTPEYVCWSTLNETVINQGDTFEIPAGGIQINGDTQN